MGNKDTILILITIQPSTKEKVVPVNILLMCGGNRKWYVGEALIL